MLKDLVECYFIWDSEGENFCGRVFDSPPSGYTSIVFNYQDSYTLTNRKHQALILPTAFMAGQSIYRYALTMGGNIGMTGAVFKPAGLHTLFGVDTGSLIEERKPLEEILDPLVVGKVRESVSEAKDDAGKIKAFESFLLQEFEVRKPAVDQIDDFAAKIASEHGMVSLSRLASEIPFSFRTLERRFKTKVGLSPKQYLRICRISHVCNLIAGRRKVNWTEVIGDTAFYDQAHFIREFEHFIGQPPSQYLSANRELANDVPKPARWSPASMTDD